MKEIFLDSDFKCHLNNPTGKYKKIETDFFDGKVDEYIEGYRFVPAGEEWVREDGEKFKGEMIAPHTDYYVLQISQLQHDAQHAKIAMANLVGTEGLTSIVDVVHAGTQTDPIPFRQNMEIYEDLYYKQYDVLYRCIRNSNQPLNHDLALLVGSHVEVVSE